MQTFGILFVLLPFALSFVVLLDIGFKTGPLYRKLLRVTERQPALTELLNMDRLARRVSFFRKIEIATWVLSALLVILMITDSMRESSATEASLLASPLYWAGLFAVLILGDIIFARIAKPILIRGVQLNPEIKIDFKY